MSASDEPIDLACYVFDGWKPRLRAAPSRRDWMDATPESFAYRCLPLNIANAHGWELLSPIGFEAEWNGGGGTDDVTIRLDHPTPEGLPPCSIFGNGVLTFHAEGLFRTPPGFNLWLSGPPNSFKDGIAPLGGVIETDWSPYSFTMNWRFTRPNHPIRFEENEPFAWFFPLPRDLPERVRPRIAPIDEAPDLKRQFAAWSASRDAFQARMRTHPPSAPADKWQKLYYRGVDADGRKGCPDHRGKLRLAEFEGGQEWPDAVLPPPHQMAATPQRRPAAGGNDGKLAWLLGSLERAKGLAEDTAIPKRKRISTKDFRDLHYAQNWPVHLTGELEGWPALKLWTPDYLKAAIGPQPVQVQTNRVSDPDFERRMEAHAAFVSFDSFIDHIGKPGAGNDTYLPAYNSAANAQALAGLHKDLGFLDKFLDRSLGAPHGMMWIGPAGTFTPLHHDLTNNLILQLVGRKVIHLVAPGETPRLYNDHHVYSRIRDLTEPGLEQRYPLTKGLRIHKVTLNPGDAIFVPLGWWHQVASLDFSVTITHTNFRWPNDFHEGYPR